MQEIYDVIVVGAGHAGCEAAAAAANMDCKVLLITMNMTTIAQMSCNPAMGGVGKGQIIREIDALGGYSGIVSDKTALQFRMLNKSKGPAMWSPRTQNDRQKFSEEWRYILENIPNLDFWQDMVPKIIVKNKTAKGVVTAMGKEFYSKTVILTNGTFLNGIIHIGDKQFSGGRSGERAAKGLTEQLNELGFESGRMKTGTPPRIDGRTINYSQTEIQEGDKPKKTFSFNIDYYDLEMKQLPCYITYTNPKVHEILKKGFNKSPLLTGKIKGVGPRYCPSIEDKIVRFEERDRHQLFIEPEGWKTHEIYLNGFSSSLPEEIQYEALRHIPGLENAKMFRPGYAIEYDFFPPYQLELTLETKLIRNLFFAGQINGTTGYEEAAAQGIMAGINAALRVKDSEPLILRRDQAYIGVLIDDLVTKGTDEPYRMFTSRAEYRILLRQDNADRRLTEIGYKIGLASEERYQNLKKKEKEINEIIQLLDSVMVEPESANEILEFKGEQPIQTKQKASHLLLRPNINMEYLRFMDSKRISYPLVYYSIEAIKAAEIEIKYRGYIEKELQLVEKMKKLENITLPENLKYENCHGLSNEAKQKLSKVKPKTIGQASRISGVTPADISALLIFIGR